MPSALCPLSCQTIFDASGRPVVGAQITAYRAGTTTPVSIYADPDLDHVFAQPVLTNGAGRIPPIYMGAGTFKFRIEDSLGAAIDEVDQIQGFVVSEIINNVTNTTADIPPGAVLPYAGTSAPAGWVRANGRTIGSAASGATELADDTAQGLFVLLWNSMPDLVVSPARGATAALDFSAGKTLALPDARRAAIAGVDGMGNGLLGGDSAYPFASIGKVFGEETHLLTTPELPAHNHDATSDTQGNHTHVSTADVQGVHTHNVVVPSYVTPGAINLGTGVDSFTFTNPTSVTEAAGSHNHNITVQDAGAHQHNITTQDTGGSAAHNNIQRTMVLTLLIKL